MKHVAWTDEYSLGIPAIDLQHRRIADALVAMAEEAARQDGSLAVSSISRLVGLLGEHFRIEESMIRKLGYPELDRHLEEHRRFHAEVENLRQDPSGVHGGVAQRTGRLLQSWQQEHIMKSDRQYVEYFHRPLGKSVGG